MLEVSGCGLPFLFPWKATMRPCQKRRKGSQEVRSNIAFSGKNDVAYTVMFPLRLIIQLEDIFWGKYKYSLKGSLILNRKSFDQT